MARRKPGIGADSGIDIAAAGGWGCYLLRCADGTLYAGATNHLARRVGQHQAGRASRYTRARLPVTAVYWAACADRSGALRAEAALKRLPRAAKLALVAQAAARPPAASAGGRTSGRRGTKAVSSPENVLKSRI